MFTISWETKVRLRSGLWGGKAWLHDLKGLKLHLGRVVCEHLWMSQGSAHLFLQPSVSWLFLGSSSQWWCTSSFRVATQNTGHRCKAVFHSAAVWCIYVFPELTVNPASWIWMYMWIFMRGAEDVWTITNHKPLYVLCHHLRVINMPKSDPYCVFVIMLCVPVKTWNHLTSDSSAFRNIHLALFDFVWYYSKSILGAELLCGPAKMWDS